MFSILGKIEIIFMDQQNKNLATLLYLITTDWPLKMAEIVEFWKVALTIAKEESNHWGVFLFSF